MFSSLAKGNGSWNGHLEEKSILDNLLPSIYQASIPSDAKVPRSSPDTFGVSTTQDCTLQLPKTYLTRKGAILLFASQNGENNEQEKQKRNNEKDESLLQDLPTFKSSCMSQSSPKPESLDQVQEKMSPNEKRKLFLEFLEVFLKDPTNKQEISPTTTDEPKSKQDYEGDGTENVLKVLSRPKSITSFYNSSHHHEVKKQKVRPKTVSGNVIPREPEQLKAHPRITSAKPSPPTRALGKIPSKNTRSEFDKEKKSIPPPMFVTRQVKTPNCSTTNETVQEDRVSNPRSNSEFHFDRSERASRAASSISRYSAWWATDDVSLSYHDKELPDPDDEYPECIECLSEQRSEIGRMPGSDIETEGDKNHRPQLKNWASKQNPQQEQAILNASSANYTAGLNDIDSQTLDDVLYDASRPGKTNKSRVKSAPCLAKKKVPKYSRTYPRKTFSAGPSRPHVFPHSQHDTAQEDIYFVRIPSTVSFHGNNDDVETISASNDLSEKPTFIEGTSTDVLKDRCDIILTNQGIPTTSSQGISFVSCGGEGSGHTMKPSSTKDGIGVHIFDHSVKTHRNDHQENCLESNVEELQESTRTDFQANLDNEIHPDQMLSEATSSHIVERMNTDLGEGGQRESEVILTVLSSERNGHDREDGEVDAVMTPAEQECLVKETELEEKHGVGRDSDAVAQDKGLTDLLHDLSSSSINESDDIKATKTDDLSEANLQGAALHETTESPHEAGFEIKELPETNTDDLADGTKPGHFDVDEVEHSSETDLKTDDSDVREIKLLPETNFETVKIKRQKTKAYYSGVVQSSSDEDTNTATLTNSVFTEHKSTDVQQDVVISAPTPDMDLRTKSTPNENSTTTEKRRSQKVKAQKMKREKLDIQGVGKADNKIKEKKENMEIQKEDKITEAKEKLERNKVQNKVDLSDLVAKKGSNKTIKKPTLGKKERSPKSRRKTIVTSEHTPEPESNLDVIPAVDEDLLNMIENLDGDLELSEETLNQFAPVEDFQDPVVVSVLEDSSNQTTDAFSPSKVKKGGKKAGSSNKKKGRVVESDMSEERKKKAEEKAKQDEEMKLLQEREEEQMRQMEEAKEKQRTIEEERDKRLAQETEARNQQELAEQALKEAKKKAKEEREKRREVEAERRKMEVQRKREEKRKRELEIQKREEELARQREDRELKMAELQAEKERELELERIAEEQRQEEERLRLLELEEEKRQEEEKIREAEEAVQRMAREREYREQMRKIAEAQQAKLEKQEVERRAKEEQERAAIEEERAWLEHEAQMRENEEQERVRELRQKEAIARIRAAHEASKRRAWALRRRAQNTERMSHLRFTRHAQKLTEAFTFSYHVHVPREVWELPYDWNSKKKRGNRPLRKKQTGEKKP